MTSWSNALLPAERPFDRVSWVQTLTGSLLAAKPVVSN